MVAARAFAGRAVRVGAIAVQATSCSVGQPEQSGGDGAVNSVELDLLPPTERMLELFSWWTAPGEAEAFQRLVDTHKARFPSSRLFNAAAASGVKAKLILKQRLIHRQQPDLFQENAHDLNIYVHEHPGSILALDDMFDALRLRAVIFPEVISDLTVDGHIYSMPVNLHRENSMLYNRRLFQLHGIAVPRNLTELKKSCEAFKTLGVTPIATSHQGWIQRIMFNSIVAAHMGIAHYRDYFTGKLPAEDPALRDSIRYLDDLLTNYTNSDAGEEGFGWMNAAQTVLDGDAAMYFHGDWAKGYLAQFGGATSEEIGVVVAPGTQGLFLYNIDVFAIPSQAPNEAGAKAFLVTIASGAAQAAFNRIKGSSPIRSDAPIEQLDAIGQATMRDLRDAKVRMLLRSGDGWDDALGRFAKDRDAEELYHAYVSHPSTH